LGLMRVNASFASSTFTFQLCLEKGKLKVSSFSSPASPSFHIPGYPPSCGEMHTSLSCGCVQLARMIRSAMCPERGRRSAVSALNSSLASFSPCCSISSVKRVPM